VGWEGSWELQTAESAGLAVLLCPLQLSLATYRGRTPSTVIMWLFRALAFRAAMGTAFASLHDSSRCALRCAVFALCVLCIRPPTNLLTRDGRLRRSWESTEWSTSYGMFVASLLPSWMDAARVWIVRVLRLASPLPLMGPWRKARLLGAATLIALHVISMLCTGAPPPATSTTSGQRRGHLPDTHRRALLREALRRNGITGAAHCVPR
jgi:hypothetical protein